MDKLLKGFSLDFFSLKGQAIIITGANGGFGKSLSAALAIAGADLLLVDISDPDQASLRQLEEAGAQVEFVQQDLTEPEAAARIVGTCIARFGRLDILVNNAGICRINKPLDFSREEWDPMLNLNITAAFDLCHEVIKVFIPQRKGKIINMCSVMSMIGGRWSPGYTATKHALAGLTKAYADDLGEFNIQVNAIAPGYFATDFTAIIYDNRRIRELIRGRIPAQRWGEPRDLMGAIIFLSSRASDYISGHILVVDGGYYIR